MSELPGWTPLVDPARREQVLEAVNDLIGVVVARDSDQPDGDAGVATLLAQAARLDLLPTAAELAGARLEAIIESLGDRSHSVGLWGGVAGVAWAVAQLADPEDAEEICAVLDEDLLGRLDEPAWAGDYDLISGLVGIGVAAVERLDAPGAQRVAGRVLDHLERAAREETAGLAWFTPPELLAHWQREICPEGYYNLGLAHGIPGVVGLMAALVSAGFELPRSRRLLAGAVRWLRACVPSRAPGRFPTWWGPGIADRPARMAWCYGDPGVAVTLLAAARALGDTDLEAEAIAMGHAMATRPFESTGVVDTGICHGAAGVAHIFNRMYQATGDAVLGEAARSWIDRLLAMRRRGAVVGSEAGTGLLTGASGVALVLLAAATDIEPAWDRCLLVGVPR